MSPAQLKKLQALSLIFSEGKASPKQIQELSDLLAHINKMRAELAFKTENVLGSLNN
ncbi:MAG: hypothetical protein QF552_03295 [Litorilituus sp.]|jgi:hypothetical protein|nr:hypothetical protein [Litorilituus sp.]